MRYCVLIALALLNHCYVLIAAHCRIFPFWLVRCTLDDASSDDDEDGVGDDDGDHGDDDNDDDDDDDEDEDEDEDDDDE